MSGRFGSADDDVMDSASYFSLCRGGGNRLGWFRTAWGPLGTCLSGRPELLRGLSGTQTALVREKSQRNPVKCPTRSGRVCTKLHRRPQQTGSLHPPPIPHHPPPIPHHPPSIPHHRSPIPHHPTPIPHHRSPLSDKIKK